MNCQHSKVYFFNFSFSSFFTLLSPFRTFLPLILHFLFSLTQQWGCCVQNESSVFVVFIEAIFSLVSTTAAAAVVGGCCSETDSSSSEYQFIFISLETVLGESFRSKNI